MLVARVEETTSGATPAETRARPELMNMLVWGYSSQPSLIRLSRRRSPFFGAPIPGVRRGGEESRWSRLSSSSSRDGGGVWSMYNSRARDRGTWVDSMSVISTVRREPPGREILISSPGRTRR